MAVRNVFALTGQMCEDLPVLRAGVQGCLLSAGLDLDSVALLRLLDDDDRPWSWHRSSADPAMLVLDRPILGLEVAGPDPSALAEGLEHLADQADRILPVVQGEAEAAEDDSGGSGTLRDALAAALRSTMVLPGVGLWAPGSPRRARFRPADRLSSRTPYHAFTAAELDALRARPEVQDHRPSVPPRPRRPESGS